MKHLTLPSGQKSARVTQLVYTINRSLIFGNLLQELAVIVARGRDGSILCYPVVETIHK